MPKKSLEPVPVVGDRVRLRGREPVGVLRQIDAESSWARVEWDSDAKGPDICHLRELQPIN